MSTLGPSQADAPRDDAALDPVFRASPDPMFLLDVETLAVVAANAVAQDLFGYTPEELAEPLPPESWRLTETTRQRVLATLREAAAGTPQRFKADTTHPRVRWIEVGAALLPSQPPRLLVTVRDETARRDTLRRFAETAERFRIAFDHAPFGMSLCTLEGVHLQVNQALCELLGLRPDELIGRPMLEVTHPDDTRATALSWEQVATEGAAELDERLVHREGAILEVRTTRALVRGAQAEPRYVICQVLDRTAHRQAERALRASEERFRTALDHATIGMCITDLAGRLLRVNPALCRLLDQQPSDVVGRELLDFVQPADLHLVREALRQIGQRPEVALEFRLKRGEEELWVHLGATAIDEPGGGPRYVLAEVQDVSGRRRQDADRRRLEEQLRRSQRMEAVGRLAGGVAHDFNNMLSVILNYADFARDRIQDDARTLEYLEAIRKAALRSSALTRQLMIFGRREVVRPEVLDLNLVVGEMQRLLYRTLGEDVELRTSLDPDLRRVLMARHHAEQILMNLAVNARDAMPHGGELTVGTENIDLDVSGAMQRVGVGPGAYVRLTIRDTGVGMNPEILAHAFEPFYTTKRQHEGTGLGLSIVYGIVSDAGGHIHVDTAPGRGARFEILLPVTEADEQPTSVIPLAPPDRARGEVVLVVEDEPAVRDLTVEILRGHGYAVLAAGDPLSALDICRREIRLDLLITDVIMPRMPGDDLADRVRADRPGVKVLYMSGHTQARLARRRVSLPEVFLLQKPFDADELLHAVRHVLDRSD